MAAADTRVADMAGVNTAEASAVVAPGGAAALWSPSGVALETTPVSRTGSPRLHRRALLATTGALATGGALYASGALAQTPPTPGAGPRVLVQTGAGAFTVELAADKAPITCANFLRYVDARRYDGGTFYRALKLLADPLTGLAQGGVKNDPGKAFPPIAHESTRATGLSHKDGTISMARYAPGTATSEVFICVGDIVSLDADPSQPGDNEGFAAFGRVVQGMETVRAILLSPVSPTAGEGALKGQMLEPEVPIISARRA
jgi:peptidyl-prolyl cis-trans isomerase A (cyclophilin A)